MLQYLCSIAVCDVIKCEDFWFWLRLHDDGVGQPNLKTLAKVQVIVVTFRWTDPDEDLDGVAIADVTKSDKIEKIRLKIQC